MTIWSTRSITAPTARPVGSCSANRVENRYVNLEADLFADGGYTILIVASDAASHSAGRYPDRAGHESTL